MRGKGGLAIAAVILLLLAAACVGFGAAVLHRSGVAGRQALALLLALPGPGPLAAYHARRALEGAAVVTVGSAVAGWIAAWALSRLPGWWSALAGALLCFPGLSVVLGWVLAWIALLPLGGPVGAALTAGAALHWPFGPRLLLIAVLAPPLALALAGAWRSVDPVALRAAVTCRIGAARRFGRLVLPELLGPLADWVVAIFLISFAVLALGSPALPLIDAAGMGTLATMLAAIVLGVALIWGAAAQRRPA